jgi:FHS family L-fucose permease-like MFS transporter
MIVTPSSSSQNRDSSSLDAPVVAQSLLPTFLLISGLFFLWGVPNNLNDVLIRQFMKSFVLSRFQAGLVQSAFYLGYFTLAIPAGLLMRRRGFKAGFITGLICFAVGCFLFWPAALSGSYSFFLVALFVVASGLAFLETAANPFIALLGSASTSERRLNIAQSFNPVGAICGVLIGTRFIFSGIELSSAQIANMQAAGSYAAYLHRETLRVVTPYLVLGCVALLWAAVIAKRKLPEPELKHHGEHDGGGLSALLSNRPFLIAVLAQFVYVGAQVGTWSYFIQYAQDATHVAERTAGLLLTSTLVMFGLGRLSAAVLMRWFEPSRLMMLYCAINVCLLAFSILHPGWVGLVCVLITSFFMSVMFPTIFAMGLRHVRGNSELAGSLLVMAIIGGAVITPLMGVIAERNAAQAYCVPAVAYILVLLYALSERRAQLRT